MMRNFLGAATALAMAAPAFAEPPILDLPIDCTLGQNCYIQSYLDHQSGENRRDYTCGYRARDGHRGTDFALFSFEALAESIDVLAAAPGRVSATRDGVEDRAVSDENRASIEGRECGNAVKIDHGEGWNTVYCHLQRGSIAVRTGDVVHAGDRVGFVGLSGQTNFPHVHFSVLKDGERVDPFQPTAKGTCGIASEDGLWRDAPDYVAAGLFSIGFSTKVPSFDEVKSGEARVTTTTPDTPLVLYGFAFLPQPGDVMRLQATGPNGDIFDHSILLDAPKKQLFRAFGRKSPSGGWPTGTYRGDVWLERDGTVLAVQHTQVKVAP